MNDCDAAVDLQGAVEGLPYIILECVFDRIGVRLRREDRRPRVSLVFGSESRSIAVTTCRRTSKHVGVSILDLLYPAIVIGSPAGLVGIPFSETSLQLHSLDCSGAPTPTRSSRASTRMPLPESERHGVTLPARRMRRIRCWISRDRYSRRPPEPASQHTVRHTRGRCARTTVPFEQRCQL